MPENKHLNIHYKTFLDVVFLQALQRSKVEVTKLRRDNTSLDVERHERDKTLNHLRTRIAVLEQENKDNQEVGPTQGRI